MADKTDPDRSCHLSSYNKRLLNMTNNSALLLISKFTADIGEISFRKLTCFQHIRASYYKIYLPFQQQKVR